MNEPRLMEPAFPFHTGEMNHYGMTLRDYFAAKAMQGMLSRPMSQGDQLADEVSQSNDKLSEWSYSVADAMLKSRTEPKL